MKDIVTSNYDFAALREDGDHVYVDMTDILAKLALKSKEKSFSAHVHVAERQIVADDIDGLVSEALYRLYAKMHPEVPSARGFAEAVVETPKFEPL